VLRREELAEQLDLVGVGLAVPGQPAICEGDVEVALVGVLEHRVDLGPERRAAGVVHVGVAE
jgi:hypothetical protein